VSPLRARSDLCQGRIGDCWLIAAMAAIADHDAEVAGSTKGGAAPTGIVGPGKLIEGVFLTGEAELACGVCAVRLFINEQWYGVLVDSRLPWDSAGKELCFVKSKERRELWPAMVEKAYAKLFEGKYQAIQGGSAMEGLSSLTGYPAHYFPHSETEAAVVNGKLFRDMLRWRQSGFLVGAGTMGRDDTHKSDTGIVERHAYSILDVQDVEGFKMVQLRNPWGASEWNGDWSDRSPLWEANPRVARKLRHAGAADDGAFWMTYADYVRYYAHTDTLMLMGLPGWMETTFTIDAATAALGRPGTEQPELNPQLWLRSSVNTEVLLTCRQAQPNPPGNLYYSTVLYDAHVRGEVRFAMSCPYIRRP
jgi:calpain-15